MIEGELTRYSLGRTETLGVLQVGGLILHTLEDAWINNQRMVSCIPVGDYVCVPRRFHRGGYDAWEVSNVPGRTQILIHKGNVATDVTGCILVGSRVGVLAGNVAVLESSAAFNRLYQLVGGLTWRLKIRAIQQQEA